MLLHCHSLFSFTKDNICVFYKKFFSKMTDETEKMWANVLELNFRPVKNEANRRKKKERKRKTDLNFDRGQLYPLQVCH